MIVIKNGGGLMTVRDRIKEDNKSKEEREKW